MNINRQPYFGGVTPFSVQLDQNIPNCTISLNNFTSDDADVEVLGFGANDYTLLSFDATQTSFSVLNVSLESLKISNLAEGTYSISVKQWPAIKEW